jgi:hypothetical protein
VLANDRSLVLTAPAKSATLQFAGEMVAFRSQHFPVAAVKDRPYAFRLDFVLLAAATSALLTADRPGGAQRAASIPDFSGIWAHYSFPGFEPPLSGPRPVMNKLRATNPNRYGFVGDYTNPILKPRAAEAVKKHGEMELRGALAPNPRNQCWPRGGPFAFSNVGIQIIQQPDRPRSCWRGRLQASPP